MFYAGLPRSARSLAASSIFLLPAVSPAGAHDAPSGWKYPYACCALNDCRPVEAKAISERPEGFVIKNTGEVIAYADRRVKNSPDGEYHWCSVAGGEKSRTICLFVPPKGF